MGTNVPAKTMPTDVDLNHVLWSFIQTHAARIERAGEAQLETLELFSDFTFFRRLGFFLQRESKTRSRLMLPLHLDAGRKQRVVLLQIHVER